MSLVSNFNESQIKAILHKEGAMVVVAGPGSGKTTVITNRVVKLIDDGIDESRILVISFTKSSAQDMKNRFLYLVEKAHTDVTFATFHRLFYMVLRSNPKYKNAELLNEIEKEKSIREICVNNKIYFEKDTLSEFLKEYTLLKSKCYKENEKVEYFFSKNEFYKIYCFYESFKKENGYIDFDDMISLAYYELLENKEFRKLWQSKYDYVLIDEFQDINEVQYKSVRLILNHDNFFIVGDDDQSIYGFRGSNPSFLLDFKSDYPKAKSIALSTNYRSTNNIINFTNKVIKENENRLDKDIVGVRDGDVGLSLLSSETVFDESRFIAKKILKLHEKGVSYEEIAVLFRINMQASVLVETFLEFNIPFIVKDGFYNIHKHFIFRDFIAYINLANDPNNKEQARLIVNRPNRFISKILVEQMCKADGSFVENIIKLSGLPEWRLKRIFEFKAHLVNIKNKAPYDAFKYFLNVIGYDEFLVEYAENRKVNLKEYYKIIDELKEEMKRHTTFEDYFKHIEEVETYLQENKENLTGVTLATLHSAKGLEFDSVFLISAVEGLIPYERDSHKYDLEEERRLFYVGLTRAKNKLFVSIIKEKNDEKAEMSRFMKNIIKVKKG
ncbi:MAG: ATP-dependent helicase [Lachnospirales bacterium]